MKCIQCGTDNNLKDRTANQGRCKNCSHPFVFEPTAMGKLKITDPMFAKAIANLSLDNTLYFTPKQFFYLLDKRLRGKSFNITALIISYVFFGIWMPGFIGGILSGLIGNSSFIIVLFFYNLGCIFYLYNQSKSVTINNKARKNSAKMLIFLGLTIIVIGICAAGSINNSSIIFMIFAAMGIFSIYLGIIGKNQTKNSNQEFLVNRNQFQEWLNRWQEINGSIEKLLPPAQEQIAPVTVDSDITDYSFDRLIVCDRTNIAQILIANNFHFENNCAILSITGYPQSIFEVTMQMLRRNSNLEVYALHDCTPRGISLVNRLRTSPQWFANTNITIIDIGLTPGQMIKSSRNIFIQNTQASGQATKQLSPEIRQNLSDEEIQWLESGNFVELESFTPKRLIQVLNRCISRVNNSTYTDDNFVTNDDFETDDSSDDIYLVQSFG